MANLKVMSVAELLKLQGDVAAALSDKRKDLERQLSQLSGEVRASKVEHHLKGRKVAPMYRSLKDPKLTWSGRGAKARWLVDEMKATKKKLAAFAIK